MLVLRAASYYNGVKTKDVEGCGRRRGGHTPGKEEPCMQIIVVGAGKVGRALTAQLTEEGYDIVVIDHKPELVENHRQYL